MNHISTHYGWHFLGHTLRDGSPIPDEFVWLPKLDNLIICERGYHGSAQPFDALQYAPGNTLTYCEYRGDIVSYDDKFCASERRIICRMDAEEMLYYFARMQALSVLHLWEPPDVVTDYLLSGDAELLAAARAAARGSAWAAAWDAAWDAARAAARGSAWAAAQDAAWDAAWAAARGSAWAAAQDAAWAAARGSAWAAAWDAAWAAARGSARGSAWAAQRTYFNELVYECFESVVNPDGSHK